MPKKKVGQRLADGSMLDLGYTINEDEVSQIKEIANKVPKTRKINNKELSEDITLTFEDLGTIPNSIVTLEAGTINASDLEDGFYRIKPVSIYKWRGTTGTQRIGEESLLILSTDEDDKTVRHSILFSGSYVYTAASNQDKMNIIDGMDYLLKNSAMLLNYYSDFDIFLNNGSMREDWQKKIFFAAGKYLYFKNSAGYVGASDHYIKTNQFDLLYIGEVNESGHLNFALFQHDGIVVGYGANSRDVPDPKKIPYNQIATLSDLPSDYVSFNAQTLTEEQKTQARANIGAGTSDFSGDYNDLDNIPTDHITKDVDNLTNYTLSIDEASKISLVMDKSTYILTAKLLNSKDEELSSSVVDFPLESMVVNASYDSTNKQITLTLKNGNTTSFSIEDLISGLATSQELANVEAKIPTDYVPNTDPVYEQMATHYNRTLNMADLSFDRNVWWSNITRYYPILDSGQDPYENFYYNSFKVNIFPYANCIILEKNKTYSMAFDTRMQTYPSIVSSGESIENKGFFFREIKLTGKYVFTPTSGFISSFEQIIPVDPYFQITTDTTVKHFEISFVAQYNMILTGMEFHFHVPNVSVDMNSGGPLYTGNFVFNEGATAMEYQQSHGRIAYTSQIPSLSGCLNTGASSQTKYGSLTLENKTNGISLFLNSTRLYANANKELIISTPEDGSTIHPIKIRPGGNSKATYGVNIGISGIIPEAKNMLDLGDLNYKFVNLCLSGGIYNNNNNKINLPSSAGTLALTKDIKVTSVNGQTGDVTITSPVTSVNGQTGDVTIQEPDVSDKLTGTKFSTNASFNTYIPYTESSSGNTTPTYVATFVNNNAKNGLTYSSVSNLKTQMGVVDTTSAQDISGVKKFTNGVKVGSANITYDSTNKCVKFTFD